MAPVENCKVDLSIAVEIAHGQRVRGVAGHIDGSGVEDGVPPPKKNVDGARLAWIVTRAYHGKVFDAIQRTTSNLDYWDGEP